MIARIRLLVVMTRPPVVWLLAAFAATGLAQAGRAADPLGLAKVLVAVLGLLLFSIACNDLADQAIDQVNLPGQRPLAAGTLTGRTLLIAGLSAGAVALAVSAALGWPALLIVAAGMAVSAAYSLRPLRLASRGAVASLVLPACYVAVPYLLGLTTGDAARHASLRPGDLLLLAGLYVGFIGRILLKDFRDLRGDELFGKRTFLVRHGRRWTCCFSACCWVAGTAVILLAVRQPTPALLAAEAGCCLAALGLLRALARDRGPRRDENLISTIAIVGRAMIVMLLAHLSMTVAHWPALRADLVISALCLLTAGPAASMLRHGPVRRALPASTWARLKRETPGPRPTVTL